MFKGSRRDREATEKRSLLRALIDGEGERCTNAIIFCNRKTDVDIVAKSLKKNGYDAAPIHGDLDQSQRTRTLDGFREGTLRFLVASDVAARGLDVPSVSHVFNFDVPSHAEDYVHRIGRTGRAGRQGKAMMICIPRDAKNLAAIEALIQKEIPRIDSPIGTAAPDTDEAPAKTSSPKSADAEGSGPVKRTRSRRSRRKPDDAAQGTDVQSAPVEAQAETQVDTTAQHEAAPDAQPETRPAAKDSTDRAPRQQDARPRDTARGDSGRDTPGQDDKPNRSRGGRGRSGGGGGGDSRVVGMGDHMPSFIALSFDERRTS
jgi:superfamily II DNA/RNA helicase